MIGAGSRGAFSQRASERDFAAQTWRAGFPGGSASSYVKDAWFSTASLLGAGSREEYLVVRVLCV